MTHMALMGNHRVIDLDILRNNVKAIRASVPEGAQLMAVVKADAYGHGAPQVAKAALEAGASQLAVAICLEGIRLRESGITAPILVLGAADPREAEIAEKYDLTLSAGSPECIRQLGQSGFKVKLHLKLDTGMGRIGVCSAEAVDECMNILSQYSNLCLTGTFTHFADCDGEAPDYTMMQFSRFKEMISHMPSEIVRHCANSAAIHRLMPDAAFNMVRMGISLYGYPPVKTDCAVKPFMQWKTRITHLKTVNPGDYVSYGCTWQAKKETKVATFACGYGDGYHRRATGKACVLIHGKKVPVIGRICMDQMMCDVSEIDDVAIGDTVTLIGHDGSENISAEDIASWAETISYEVLLAATGRVERIWLNE